MTWQNLGGDGESGGYGTPWRSRSSAQRYVAFAVASNPREPQRPQLTPGVFDLALDERTATVSLRFFVPTTEARPIGAFRFDLHLVECSGEIPDAHGQAGQ